MCDFITRLVRQRSGSPILANAAIVLYDLEKQSRADTSKAAILALETTIGLQATHPRDKLFSLSNIVDLSIEVNYSLYYSTLCTRFARV